MLSLTALTVVMPAASGRGSSCNAVHVDEVEAEVSDLFQDPVECGLVGDPTV